MRANRDPGRLIPLTAQEIEQVSGASVAEGIGDIREGVRTCCIEIPKVSATSVKASGISCMPCFTDQVCW